MRNFKDFLAEEYGPKDRSWLLKESVGLVTSVRREFDEIRSLVGNDPFGKMADVKQQLDRLMENLETLQQIPES